MERRNFVGGLFCDMQKAFNCVNHEILLEKMKLYGISGTVNKLMESYLKNMYQRVSVNNIKPHKLYSKLDTCEAWGSAGLGIGSIIVSYLYKRSLIKH